MKRIEMLVRASALTILIAAILFAVGPRSSAQATTAPSFSVKVLAPFGANAGDDYPNSINDQGDIVGYVHESSLIKGFVYEPGANGSTGHSRAMPVPKGDSAAVFNEVNDNGAAAGYVCADSACKHDLPYAGKINGSAVGLTPLRGPSSGRVTYGRAVSINSSGAITGFDVMASGKRVGLVWKNVGSSSQPRWSKPKLLATPKSYSAVSGSAIDSAGDVAGYGLHGKYAQATIAGPSGRPVAIPGLVPGNVPDVTQTYANAAVSQPENRAASRDGSITVVGYSYESGSGNNQNNNPAAWRVTVKAGKVAKVSQPIELGTDYNDPDGGGYGGANSINDQGWIVGDAGLDTPSPMLWMTDQPSGSTPTFSSFQLQNLTPDYSPACAFIQANSVNDKGQIVGTFVASSTKFVIRGERLGTRLPSLSETRRRAHAVSSSADGSCSPVSDSYQSIYVLTPVSASAARSEP